MLRIRRGEILPMNRVILGVLACATLRSAGWEPARLPDGQPDVQGFWQPTLGGTYSLTNPRRGGGRLRELLLEKEGKAPPKNPSRIVDPADGKIPYLPWAAAKQQ